MPDVRSTNGVRADALCRLTGVSAWAMAPRAIEALDTAARRLENLIERKGGRQDDGGADPGEPNVVPAIVPVPAPAEDPLVIPVVPVIVKIGGMDFEYQRAGSVAIVRVAGALTFSRAWWNRWFGMIAMPDLVDLCGLLEADSLSKSVLFDVHSPGGTVWGGEDLIQAVRKLDAVKPVVGLAHWQMASGAYIAFCQGRKVIATPGSELGSCACLQMLYDESAMFDEMGVKVHALTSFNAGKKAPGYGGSKITQTQLEAEQEVIDQSGEWYRTRLMEGRGITEAEAMEMMDGRVQIGEHAVAAGFADDVMSLEDLVAEMNEAEIE